MKEHRPSRKGSAPEKPQAKEEFDPGQGWEDTEELDKTRPGEDADDPDVVQSRLLPIYNAGNFQVQVAAIPEPETYAMMLVGLCVIAWARRARRRGLGEPQRGVA